MSTSQGRSEPDGGLHVDRARLTQVLALVVVVVGADIELAAKDILDTGTNLALRSLESALSAGSASGSERT